MRDIADDLKERIEATHSEMALVRSEYEAAKRDIEQAFIGRFGRAQEKLRALELLFEEETGEKLPTNGAKNIAGGLRLPMADFIVNALVTTGVKSKEEIRDLVERAGYGSASEGPGRAVHTTLLNLVKSGRLLIMSDGLYDAAKAGVF